MPRYEVTAWTGTIRVEVEASDEDAAILEADEKWLAEPPWIDATYEVRELSD